MKLILKLIAQAILPRSVFLEMRARRGLRAAKDPESELLPLLAGTGVFVDVGANIGVWSIAAAKSFRAVHAFEPDLGHAAALRRLLPSNVTVHGFALSDHSGVGRLAIPIHEGLELTSRASLESHANVGFVEIARQVPLVTLDQMDLRDIDVMKIDVEGHEAAVLDGAWRSIERDRPTLIIEIEERHHPGRSEEIIDRILKRNYACCFLRNGRLEEFERGTIEALQPKGGHNEIDKKHAAYTNNFFFVPRERKSQIEAMRGFLRTEKMAAVGSQA